MQEALHVLPTVPQCPPPPQVWLVYEWECLIREVEQLQSSFDQALMMLRHEKAGIDVSVITADLRLDW